MSEKEIRSLGHDLSDIYLKCQEHGIKMRTIDKIHILNMYKNHKEHVFRYGFQGEIKIAPPKELMASAANLIDIVTEDPRVLRKNRGENGADFDYPIDYEHPSFRHWK